MAQSVAEFDPMHYYDEDVDDYPQEQRPLRVLNNVTLRDLQKNEGAEIQLDVEYNDDFYEMDKTFEREIKEISHVASFRLREDRVAPRPEQSFESLESEMQPVDEHKHVLKKIITPGAGADLPDIAKVVVDYEFYKEHDPIPFDSTFLQGRKKRFIVRKLTSDEDNYIDVIPGLYIAVQSMKKRETSKFIIKWPAAFGEKGIPPRVDPKMDILAIVTLIDFSEIVGDIDNNALTEEELHKTDFEESIKKVKSLEHEAKKFFQSQNFHKASNLYKRGVNDLNRLHLANQEEEMRMFELKDKLLVNLAICYNNIKRPEAACLACQEVISRQSNNSKAFYQLAKGKYFLGNFNDCRRFCLKAKALAPKNSEINALLKKCNDKEAAVKAEERERYKRMLAQTSPQKNEQDKAEKDNESVLTTFEKTLREALTDHFDDSVDDFIYPARLTPEEIQTSLKVAEDLKLNYEEREDGIHFLRKAP